ncbi:hypothetical protein AV935_09410 [Levilactobacillus brevis]|nr:hypothetical protein AV935_09410 [Levilactobacillus brevis]
MSTNNGIVFETFSGYSSRKVTLYENNLALHVIGNHPDRDFLFNESNLRIIANVIESPSLVYKDKSQDRRYNYIDMVQFSSFDNAINVNIVTEAINKDCASIVTIIPFKAGGKTQFAKEDKVYDRHNVRS